MDKNWIAKFTISSKQELNNIFEKEVSYNLFFNTIIIKYLEETGFIALKLQEIINGEELLQYINEIIPTLNNYFPKIFKDYNNTYSYNKNCFDRLVKTNFFNELKSFDRFDDDTIGWIYQYYVSDVKEKYKQTRKVVKEDLSSMTQLFTPKWVIKYLVDNSLGNFQEKNLEYQLKNNKEQKDIRDIKIFEPCVGTGNILLYVIELLYNIYLEKGYCREKAVNYIINNIYGLDIDLEAVSLCKILLGIKLFTLSGIKQRYDFNNIYAINDKDLNEIGSLYYQDTLPKIDKKLQAIINNTYDVVVTNPPYLGRKSTSTILKEYINKNMPNAKSELYSAFIKRCIDYTCTNGYVAMITLHTWMFISSYGELRKEIINNYQVESILHSGAGTFEDVNSFNALACAFVIRKSCPKKSSLVINLSNIYDNKQKQKEYFNQKNYYEVEMKMFLSIPHNPFIYAISKDALMLFDKYKLLKDEFVIRAGLATGDNKKYVRYWYEVPKSQIGFNMNSIEEALASGYTYFPYNKGGNFRKWYGMNEYVIKFDKESYDALAKQGNKLPSKDYYFKKGITWSLFGFEKFSVRYKENGFVFDVSGSSMFPSDEYLYYLLGFLSSSSAFYLLNMINPTVNFQIGNIGTLPFVYNEKYKNKIEKLVKENIYLAKCDWDDEETSFDFTENQIIKLKKENHNLRFLDCYQIKVDNQTQMYYKVKNNEERINQIFKEIYQLNVKTKLNDKDLTIQFPDKKTILKSFIHRIVHLIMIEKQVVEIKDLYKLFINKIEEIFINDNCQNIINFIEEGIESSLSLYFTNHLYFDIWKKYSKKPIYLLFENKKAVQILVNYDTLSLDNINEVYKIIKSKDIELIDYQKKFKFIINNINEFNFEKDGIDRFLDFFKSVIKVYE